MNITYVPHLTGVQIAFFHVGAEETKDLAMYRFEIQHLLVNPLWGFDHQQVNPFKHLTDAAHR